MALFPDDVRRFVSAAGPAPTDVQREMERYGRDRDFPLIGPEIGGLLAILTRMVGARTVFEFGSGFGYSASWFLRGLPADGEVVLTEIDTDEVDVGRDFLDRTGNADRVTYEIGDAMTAVDRHDGPFDVVFIDHAKEHYAAAFDAAADKVEPGGVVLADNLMQGPYDFDDVLAGLEGSAGSLDEKAQGIVDYVERTRDAPEFESTVVPVGTGLGVSLKRR